MIHCRYCYSAQFRLSTFRFKDLARLLVLLYPLRCLECSRRKFVFLPMALLYRRPPSATVHKPHSA